MMLILLSLCKKNGMKELLFLLTPSKDLKEKVMITIPAKINRKWLSLSLCKNQWERFMIIIPE